MPVTQADRETLAEILPLLDKECGLIEQGLARDGEFDDHPAMARIAAHREAALDDAAGVAQRESETGRDYSEKFAARSVASAILALKAAPPMTDALHDQALVMARAIADKHHDHGSIAWCAAYDAALAAIEATTERAADHCLTMDGALNNAGACCVAIRSGAHLKEPTS